MAKGKSSAASSAAADQDNKTEVKQQAVLLCDSFTQTFRPLSLDQPKVLCPLNNGIMMDYALEFLVGAGVEELVVVCGSTLVEDHVMQSYWNSKSSQRLSGTSSSSSGLQVKVVRDASISNVGDALRELDKRNWIQCDPFILMYGDVITNVDLSSVIAQHQQRHKKDSSAIMTILFHQVGGWNVMDSNENDNEYGREEDHDEQEDEDDDHDGLPLDDSTRPSGTTTATNRRRNRSNVLASPLRESKDDLIVGIDPTQDNRILVFDDHPRNKTVKIPCSFWTSHSNIEFHTDWMDCGIYLCSPDVLARFSDEFDYTDLRKEFVANSVAEEEEGLQNKLYAHVLRQPCEYAARVHDTYTYGAISQDILRRWCYPVVPDRLPMSGGLEGNGGDLEHHHQQRHRYTYRNFLYRAQSSSSHRTSKLGRKSVVKGPGMIGADCTIEESCQIRSCVIGNGCFIGNHVTLNECHIWDNVRIEDGATIHQSILGNDVIVHASATIGRGCILGRGCVVGKGVTLPPFTRLTLVQEAEDDMDFDDFGDSLDDDKVGAGKDPANDNANGERVEVTDHNVVGPDGRGHVWRPTLQDYDEEDDDMEDDAEDLIQAQSLGFDRNEFYRERMEQQKEKDDDLSETSDMEDKGHFESYTGGSVTFEPSATLHPSSSSRMVTVTSSSMSAPTASSSLSSSAIIGRQKGIDVIAELKQICLEHPVNAPYENLAIELNSFKFSQNATYSDCTRAAMLAVLELLNITADMSDVKLLTAFKTQLKQWAGPLLRKMCVGLDEELSVILGLEQAATSGDSVVDTQVLQRGTSFRLLLQTLHDEELVSEEAILAWAASCRQEGDSNSPRAKLFQLAPIQDFLEWLEEEDDDDDDDDDDDEEEDDDDED